MRIYPAIDLLDGACVRLYRGSYDRVTRFSPSPREVARRFVGKGARALHVVDLDGARDGTPVHLETVLRIREAAGVMVQVGGGLRSVEHVTAYLDGGVERVVLGTAAVRDPSWLARMVNRYGPERVAASLDVRDGRVVVEGWREGTGVEVEAYLSVLEESDVEILVYTDTARDGTLASPDVEGARAIARRGFHTLVAGGISRPEHLRALREAGATGAIVGRALYEGELDLNEALVVAGEAR